MDSDQPKCACGNSLQIPLGRTSQVDFSSMAMAIISHAPVFHLPTKFRLLTGAAVVATTLTTTVMSSAKV
jgi:hypothetical protein